MAAQIRELRQRIRTVNSTKKITKAYEPIATSRLAKAQARVAASRPYADEITNVLSALAEASANLDHPLLVERENPKRAAILVVTSDKGMCGGYNSNVLKAAEELIALLRSQGKEPVLYTLGRKAVYRVGTWAALLFAFPTAALIQSENRAAIFVAFVGGLGLLYGVIYGPLAAFWAELFDTRYRYTALSTLYQVSGIVASGLTPLIAAWLVSRGGGSLWLVSVYASVVAVVSLVSARLLPETAGRDLDEAWKTEARPSDRV